LGANSAATARFTAPVATRILDLLGKTERWLSG
jgi:hypothetical protein